MVLRVKGSDRWKGTRKRDQVNAVVFSGAPECIWSRPAGGNLRTICVRLPEKMTFRNGHRQARKSISRFLTVVLGGRLLDSWSSCPDGEYKATFSVKTDVAKRVFESWFGRFCYDA